MPLKKSYSAAFDIDGKCIREQRDIDMHPMEEEMHRAQWAIGAKEQSLPQVPTHKQEHDWLIEHGPEYVKKQRMLVQGAWQDAQIDLKVLHGNYEDKKAQWDLHSTKCHAHGLDYDTHPDGRGLPDIEEKK